MKSNFSTKINFVLPRLCRNNSFKPIFFWAIALSFILFFPVVAVSQEAGAKKTNATQTTEHSPQEISDAASTLNSLAARAKGITFIKSSFRQTKYLSFMDEKVVSEGFFTFEAPQELLWQYITPVTTGFSYKNGTANMWSANCFVTNNSTATAKDAANQPQCSKAEEIIAKSIASHILPWVSFDTKLILKTYNVQILNKKPLTLKLTPKELIKGSPIRFFELTFGSNNIDVQKIVFHEQDDDTTQIDFYNSEHR